MGNFTESITWETAINEIATSDQLLGGDGGPLNIGAGQLANRTQWLKMALQGYAGVQSFSANHTLTRDEVLFNLVVIDATGATLAITMPDSAIDPDNLIPAGFKIVITAKNVDTSQVSLICGGADVFVDSAVTKTTLYLGDGDILELIFTSAGWLVNPLRGNFDSIGDVNLKYKQPRNTLIAQGQLVTRAAYPRLWEWVQTLGASLIDDAAWTGSTYQRGFYSMGNGTTNFRIPDLRAMFFRSLDLSAGIDTGRIGSNAGAYEDDAIKAHSHAYSDNAPKIGIDFGNGSTRSSWTDTQTESKTTGETGGTETRPKNIGLIPLINI